MLINLFLYIWSAATQNEVKNLENNDSVLHKTVDNWVTSDATVEHKAQLLSILLARPDKNYEGFIQFVNQCFKPQIRNDTQLQIIALLNQISPILWTDEFCQKLAQYNTNSREFGEALTSLLKVPTDQQDKFVDVSLEFIKPFESVPERIYMLRALSETDPNWWTTNTIQMTQRLIRLYTMPIPKIINTVKHVPQNMLEILPNMVDKLNRKGEDNAKIIQVFIDTVPLEYWGDWFVEVINNLTQGLQELSIDSVIKIISDLAKLSREDISQHIHAVTLVQSILEAANTRKDHTYLKFQILQSIQAIPVYHWNDNFLQKVNVLGDFLANGCSLPEIIQGLGQFAPQEIDCVAQLVLDLKDSRYSGIFRNIKTAFPSEFLAGPFLQVFGASPIKKDWETMRLLSSVPKSQLTSSFVQVCEILSILSLPTDEKRWLIGELLKMEQINDQYVAILKCLVEEGSATPFTVVKKIVDTLTKTLPYTLTENFVEMVQLCCQPIWYNPRCNYYDDAYNFISLETLTQFPIDDRLLRFFKTLSVRNTRIKHAIVSLALKLSNTHTNTQNVALLWEAMEYLIEPEMNSSEVIEVIQSLSAAPIERYIPDFMVSMKSLFPKENRWKIAEKAGMTKIAVFSSLWKLLISIPEEQIIHINDLLQGLEPQYTSYLFSLLAASMNGDKDIKLIQDLQKLSEGVRQKGRITKAFFTGLLSDKVFSITKLMEEVLSLLQYVDPQERIVVIEKLLRMTPEEREGFIAKIQTIIEDLSPEDKGRVIKQLSRFSLEKLWDKHLMKRILPLLELIDDIEPPNAENFIRNLKDTRDQTQLLSMIIDFDGHVTEQFIAVASNILSGESNAKKLELFELMTVIHPDLLTVENIRDAGRQAAEKGEHIVRQIRLNSCF